MKNLQPIFLLILFCLLTGNLLGQTGENGGWFYHNGIDGQAIIPKSHFGVSAPFPKDGLSNGNHKFTYTPKEKAKMNKIVAALKEVYPKPKYHSMLYSLYPYSPPKLDSLKVGKREYRFGYAISLEYEFMKFRNNKMFDAPLDSKEFTREFGFFSVNINHIPNFLGGTKGAFENVTLDPLLELDKDFTYKKYEKQKVGQYEQPVFRDETKDHILTFTSRDDSFADAEKYLGGDPAVPSLKFGNEADNHFVFRRMLSSRLNHSGEFLTYGKRDKRDDRANRHDVDNVVILTHNNRLPLKPLSIDRFLYVGDQILDEVIVFHKGQDMSDRTRQELSNDHARTRAFIQRLREAYKNRLQDHAIIDIRYSHGSDFANSPTFMDTRSKREVVVNKKTGKNDPVSQVISSFFVTDPKQGKAFYTYDKDYYKNMADGEIRTIAVIWKDYIRTSDNPEFGQGYTIGKDGVNKNRFTDNPDHYLYHFHRKFDWKRFAALLGT